MNLYTKIPPKYRFIWHLIFLPFCCIIYFGPEYFVSGLIEQIAHVALTIDIIILIIFDLR